MSMLIALMLSSITARGIINPVVVAAPAGGSTGLFFAIRNSSQDEGRLLRVTCDCASRIELLVARGGDLDLAGPSVVMPPQRLVELRPGGDRSMRLLRLRRPLVAGQTVAMTFHYADGSETRDVRIVADAGAGWTAGIAGEGPRRLAALAGLAGWCWRGTFPDGDRTDTRCFSPAYGNFLQDRQVLDSGPTSYTGYTLYSHDVMGMTTHFSFDGPDGPRRYGRVVPTDAGLTLEYYPQQPTENWEIRARTHWRRDGADAWLVSAEARGSTGWRELWRMRMVRAGPSPAL